MKFINQSIFLIILELLTCDIVFSTISKSSNKKKSKKEKNLGRFNVKERELVQVDVEYSEIIDNEYKYCEKEKDQRNWNSGEVLAYVTPWNPSGYDIAKTFAKFTMISPVWFQIKRKQRGFYNIEGLHDVDRKWMKSVKEINPNVKFVPRILFDGWSQKEYDSLFNSEDEIENLIEKIVSTLVETKVQGAVIEVWSQVQEYQYEDLVHVLKHLGEEFRKKGLTSILAIPPGLNAQKQFVGFKRIHLDTLAPVIDFFSMMTYDFFAQTGEPGANAPYDWIKGCIIAIDPDEKYRKQILAGLNFYGYMFGKDGKVPVLGKQYINLLGRIKPELKWESILQEHYIELPEQLKIGKTLVFYPTLKSIDSRLELLKQMGVGASIWEIGQGLDYFYDLF